MIWGDNLSVGADTVISGTADIDVHLGSLEIGSNCLISDHVYIGTHKHLFWSDRSADKDLELGTTMKIGDNVFIGRGAMILPSVSYIGDNATIGAGAVVTKNVEPGQTVVGNPATVIREG